MEAIKNQGGRPPYSPTEKDRRTVNLLAQMGTRHADIARVLGISEPTLRKYYADELDRGLIVATAKVAQSLFNMATDAEKPSVAAAIFWLKCQAGWKETAGDDAPLGKKARAQLDAETALENEKPASDGDAWSDLLPRGTGATMQ